MRFQDRVPRCLAVLALITVISPAGAAADRQVKPFVWSQDSIEGPKQTASQATPPNFVTTLRGVEDAKMIPDEVVMWSFFGFLHTLEQQNPGEARTLLERDVKLDGSAAATLQAFVSEAIAAENALQNQGRANQCAKLHGTQPVADDELAADFRAAEEAARRSQKDKVARLAGLLDVESNVKLREWVNVKFRPGFHMDSIDFNKFFASPGVTRQLVVLRLCGG